MIVSLQGTRVSVRIPLDDWHKLPPSLRLKFRAICVHIKWPGGVVAFLFAASSWHWLYSAARREWGCPDRVPSAN